MGYQRFRTRQRRAEKFFASWKASIIHAEYTLRWIISLRWHMNGDLQENMVLQQIPK